MKKVEEYIFSPKDVNEIFSKHLNKNNININGGIEIKIDFDSLLGNGSILLL